MKTSLLSIKPALILLAIFLAALIVGLLSSCTLSRQLTKTGFNQSVTFSMKGSQWSVDRLYVHEMTSQNVYHRYQITDPAIKSVVMASRVVYDSHSIATK